MAVAVAPKNYVAPLTEKIFFYQQQIFLWIFSVCTFAYRKITTSYIKADVPL